MAKPQESQRAIPTRRERGGRPPPVLLPASCVLVLLSRTIAVRRSSSASTARVPGFEGRHRSDRIPSGPSTIGVILPSHQRRMRRILLSVEMSHVDSNRALVRPAGASAPLLRPARGAGLIQALGDPYERRSPRNSANDPPDDRSLLRSGTSLPSMIRSVGDPTDPFALSRQPSRQDRFATRACSPRRGLARPGTRCCPAGRLRAVPAFLVEDDPAPTASKRPASHRRDASPVETGRSTDDSSSAWTAFSGRRR